MNMPIKKSCLNQDQWEKLHDEVAEIIFIRLPVADLFRCQFVCRRWISIIWSPYFQEALNKYFKWLPWFFMVSSHLPSEVVYDMEMDDWRHIGLPIQYLRLGFLPLAASEGLICCISACGALCVCNPLTGSMSQLILGAWLADVKAITMHSWESYYDVYVVSWKSNCLHMCIYSSGSNSLTEFPMEMFKLSNVHGDDLVPLDFADVQLLASVNQTIFHPLKDLAGVTAVDSNGDLVVYYIVPWGCLVGCNINKRTAVKCSGILHGTVGLAECCGHVIVVILKKEDGNEVLRVWTFDNDLKMLINIAVMPQEMSKGYSGIDPNISCSGWGEYIMICVSSIEYNFTKVIVFNFLEDIWKELPDCLDPRCGLPKRFTSGFAFMPSLKEAA